MDHYPRPALAAVATLRNDALAAPHKTVAFQGAPGAYSHLGLTRARPDMIPLPCLSFEDALDAVRQNTARYAFLPIENSQAGRVADIHFLLPDAGLFIVAEYFLRVQHCLVAIPGARLDQVETVLSHPQALAQCRNRLRTMGLQPISYHDTAAAAAHVADKGNPALAAIASELAAGLYGLDILARDVEDSAHNTTRFILLSREAVDPDPATCAVMTSFGFEVRSVPAALYKALGGFATNGVNMTRLESYQKHGSFHATEFLAEIEGSPREARVLRAFDELQFFTKNLTLFGSYPQALARQKG